MLRSTFISAVVGCAALGLAGGVAAESGVQVKSVDDVLTENPLPADAPVQVSWTALAANGQMLVMEVRKIIYHHHDREDHIIYVARGEGNLRLENETRALKVGDVVIIPHGAKHGFEASGDDKFVILVSGTMGFSPATGIIPDE